MARCPVCDLGAAEVKVEQVGFDSLCDCPRCGRYRLTSEANDDMPVLINNKIEARAVLSHAIYRRTIGNQQVPVIDEEFIEATVKNNKVPSPTEQLDNFILWLGAEQQTVGEPISVLWQSLAAMGATDFNSANFIFKHAIAKELVIPAGGHKFSLSFGGWEYLADLQRRNPKSRQAFMAMKFGDAELDAIFNSHFRAAVEATRFDLKRLDDEPRAGLIDDRLRVEIRQSKFLIADLSHGNAGAYWEAGFAEGLGMPVIYTCKQSVFDDPAQRPHFDTNHHLTIVWNPDNIGEAVENLKATIRATLPADAKMAD